MWAGGHPAVVITRERRCLSGGVWTFSSKYNWTASVTTDISSANTNLERSTAAVLAAVAAAFASAASLAASTAFAAGAVASESAVARSNGDFVIWTAAATFAGSACNLRRSAGAEAGRGFSGVGDSCH